MWPDSYDPLACRHPKPAGTSTSSQSAACEILGLDLGQRIRNSFDSLHQPGGAPRRPRPLKPEMSDEELLALGVTEQQLAQLNGECAALQNLFMSGTGFLPG